MTKLRPTRAMPDPTPEAIEREVRGNILAQRFGAGTVSDLNLPEEFIRRCADRVIISSFSERYRAVEPDPAGRPTQKQPPPVESPLVRIVPGCTAENELVGILPDETTDVVRGARFGAGSTIAAIRPPDAQSPYELRRAATITHAALARDGLRATVAAAAIALRPLLGKSDSLQSLLERAGLPIDLVEMLLLDEPEGFRRGEIFEWLESHVRHGVKLTALREMLRRSRLEFRKTLAGFIATDDAGGDRPLLARLQLTRGDDWLGEGDGGSLDLARQIASLLPDVALVLSVRKNDADQVAKHAAHWCRLADRTAPITILAESAIVSQWAQDNARSGHIHRDGNLVPAALLPRYASRGEERSALVPGDSICPESLALIGIEVARSPLLFQGGNLIFVHDRAQQRRSLLVGEAEVLRNVALGLSRDEVLQAMCVELGADRAIVLPAVSYHIDYEVLCIAHPETGAITACVADATAGASCIVAAGMKVLERHGKISQSQSRRTRDAVLNEPPEPVALAEIWSTLARHQAGPGIFSYELAKHFTGSCPGESAEGNFLTFLSAVDTLVSIAAPQVGSVDNPHAAAAQRSRCSIETDRESLRETLGTLGWRIVSVPTFPACNRGVSPLNAIVLPGRLLVPQVRGLFEDLDLSAIERIGQAESNVCGFGLSSAESQRRNGSARCSIEVFC